jgi:hypothetical protein
MRAFLVICSLTLVHSALAQERLVSTNAEIRTVLAFKASDGAIQKLLPEGWEMNSPTAGPTRGSNLQISLIDQIAIQDGEVAGGGLSWRGPEYPCQEDGDYLGGTHGFRWVSFEWSPRSLRRIRSC